MPDLIDKFEKAAKKISSPEKKDIRECVYCAYVDHLSDINADDLPEDIQIFYESVTDRLTSVEPPGNIGNDEVYYLAEDILYMAGVIRIQNRP
jgi:hypothetical protein